MDEPLDQRLAVMPSWVKQQLADAAGVVAEVPERAKLEFQRLGIGFVLHPVYDEGPAFLRAVGSGEFEHLVRNAHFPTSAASSRREIGSRKFVVGVRQPPTPVLIRASGRW